MQYVSTCRATTNSKGEIIKNHKQQSRPKQNGEKKTKESNKSAEKRFALQVNTRFFFFFFFLNFSLFFLIYFPISFFAAVIVAATGTCLLAAYQVVAKQLCVLNVITAAAGSSISNQVRRGRLSSDESKRPTGRTR